MQQSIAAETARERLSYIIKGGKAVNVWKKLAKRSKIRYYSLNELVNTQSDYLRDLRLIKQKMQIPLKQSGLIDEQKQNKIFSSLDGLIHLSSNLLEDCSKIIQEWHVYKSMLGPTMIYYSKFLLVYSEFLKSYKSNLDDLLSLVEKSEIARNIQNKISTQEGKLITFQNLWSRPFQRTMKYKLILKQYLENLYKNHADYPYLVQAISKYEEVSQRNNQSLQQKQKNKTLIHLQTKFGAIIDEEAKNYIDCVTAKMIDTKVNCYIFSNMLMVVSIQEKEEVQLVRLILSQSSFVNILKDIVYFKNRLFICGKRRSIHLTFDDKQGLKKCYECLKSIIYQLYLVEYTRRQLSSKEKVTDFRETLSDLRTSYTQLKEKLPSSPRLFVVGHSKRYFSYAKLKVYYIIKFMLPVGYDNSSILYVDQQKLLALQKIMRNLYENELKNIGFIQNSSKMISSHDIKTNDLKALEYKSINTTIFLNYIFRDRQILKRIDIAAHLLTINQPMWIFCKYINEKCSCNLCINGQVLNKIEDYEQQIYDRNKDRIFKYKFYCPFRTFHSQNMIAQIKGQSITKSIDRILLLKCQKHELDYRVADSPPVNSMKKKIQISFDRIQPLIKIELMIDHQQRIGQIISSIEELYRIRLVDYEMYMRIHNKSYPLGRDEVLWSIMEEQVHQQQLNFISFFRSTFREKEDLSIKLYLRKIWVLQPQYEKITQKQDKRLIYLIEEFMVRLSRYEITLEINQLATFYSTYFVLKTSQYGSNEEVTNENLKIILQQKWNVLEKKHKATILQAIKQKVQFLRNKNYQRDDLVLKIWDYINVIGKNRPGWSAYLFSAEIISFPNHYRGTKVKIGADIDNLYVKSEQKMEILFECSLQQSQEKVIISGFELRIKQKSEVYIITSDDLYNLQDIIDTYLLYKKNFYS